MSSERDSKKASSTPSSVFVFGFLIGGVRLYTWVLQPLFLILPIFKIDLIPMEIMHAYSFKKQIGLLWYCKAYN